MRIAKPLLLVITPLGVAVGLNEADRRKAREPPATASPRPPDE